MFGQKFLTNSRRLQTEKYDSAVTSDFRIDFSFVRFMIKKETITLE